MLIQPACHWKPTRIDWLWRHRLGIGKLAILEGDPGLGKSLLTLDLCARLSLGRELPDGAPSPGPCNCVYLSGEEEGDDTIIPRLIAAGADQSRVFIEDIARVPDWMLPANLGRLEQMLEETNARFLVFDPFTAFLEGVVTSCEHSIRRLVTALSALAARRRCVILLLRHLNKNAGTDALYRGGGSIALTAGCRSTWLVASDPRLYRRVVLAQVKKNLGPPQPSLSFEVVGEADAARVVWHGESPWSADQLGARRRQESPAVLRASEFLMRHLQDGPRPQREILAAAAAKSISRGTLRRAAKALELAKSRLIQGRLQTTYWRLKDQEAPKSPQWRDLAPWIEKAKEKFLKEGMEEEGVKG